MTNNTNKATKIELTEDDKEYIDLVNNSKMSEETKKRLINLVEINRMFVNKILSQIKINPVFVDTSHDKDLRKINKKIFDELNEKHK